MAEHTNSIRFFFLKPRLLKYRQLIEEQDCRAVRPNNFAGGESTALEGSLSHESARSEEMKIVEH